MIVLGLTGSIGMGKTTVAGLLAEAGLPVHDADAVVRRLYAGSAVPVIEALFPGTTANGNVDRDALRARVGQDPSAFDRLNAAIHPLVQDAERDFRAAQRAAGALLVVLDIPLLFETGADRRCDVTVVVSASAAQQRTRVLARPGMTETNFAAILERQMPDAEKRRRAHVVLDNGGSIAALRAQVVSLVRALRPMLGKADRQAVAPAAAR
jgi:dephospho-CoA kinase